MEALLDTHIAIWWFENSSNLSKRASRFWPIRAIPLSFCGGRMGNCDQGQCGKFSSAELIGDMAGFLEREAGWSCDKDRARGARGLLPLHHRDPFDRLLVAQAQALNLPILSADRGLDKYDVRRVW